MNMLSKLTLWLPLFAIASFSQYIFVDHSALARSISYDSFSFESEAQDLYVKTFGDPKDSAVIFLHGGPGYNSANFESSTAMKLSKLGMFVIVYDRRGEGRSTDNKSEFSFNQSNDDLVRILNKFSIKKACLIGHSFGGIIATSFAKNYPNRVSSIIYVGAPVSLQESFKQIISRCKTIYIEKKDTINLAFLKMLESMDSSSIQYSSMCFRHALQNKFYSASTPTEEAKSIYSNFKADTSLFKFAGKMTIDAPQGFWKNEGYTTLDLTNDIRLLLNQGMRIYGLYGKEDGLYSAKQIEFLKSLIGADHLLYLDQCSHNVFMDRSDVFLTQVLRWK